MQAIQNQIYIFELNTIRLPYLNAITLYIQESFVDIILRISVHYFSWKSLSRPRMVGVNK